MFSSWLTGGSLFFHLKALMIWCINETFGILNIMHDNTHSVDVDLWHIYSTKRGFHPLLITPTTEVMSRLRSSVNNLHKHKPSTYKYKYKIAEVYTVSYASLPSTTKVVTLLVSVPTELLASHL